MAEEQNELTNYRLATVEDAVKSIADNLTQLRLLEQKHVETREALGRAFNQIDKHDGRIRKVETEMPTLKLVRGWVITGATGIIALVGVAAFKVFIAH